MRSQHIAAIASLACFILGAAIALTASYGTAAGWWDYAAGLKLAAPGFALGLAGVAAGAVWLARALRGNDSAGWKFGALGLAGSLVLAFIPLNQLRLYFVSPPIHEVSTDVEYPPPFTALLALRAGAENGPEYDGMKLVWYGGRVTHTAAAQKKAYPDIKPYVALLNPRQTPDIDPMKILFWRGFERAKDLGWSVVYFNAHDGIIEATHKSLWFGLVSDISIRVKPAGKIGARLDIRAKSRTGVNDMGATAALVRGYLKALK
ncbi:MAG TPA: DUF1499 domain-containing protein [Rhizomicrobium sp.]|jgi:hypothetical protein|nr:DUF1499 domain-containing protein [Rhizomicrobium sp.]